MNAPKPSVEDQLLQIEAELSRQDEEWNRLGAELRTFGDVQLWFEALPEPPAIAVPVELSPPAFGVRV